MFKTLYRQTCLLIFYALIAFLAFYQPLFHVNSTVTGGKLTDYYHFHWSYWWVDHALSQGESIYSSDYVLFPYENNLAYHTMAVVWYPLWKAVSTVSNSLVAMNSIFYVAMLLTGYAMFHLLRRERVNLTFALIGGVALEVSPLMLRAIWWTNPNLVGIFWFPVALLLWGAIVQAEKMRQAVVWSVVLGVALWGMILTDLQYGMFIPFLLLPYGIFTLFPKTDTIYRVPTGYGEIYRAPAIFFCGMGAILVALSLSWLSGTLPALLAYEEGEVLRADLANTWGIYFPSGYLWNAPDYHSNPRIGGIAVGAFLLALMIIFFRRGGTRKDKWFWFGLAVIPLLLSFGADITLLGQTIPMPYRLYHAALGGLFRFPERFGTVFMIPALVFAGIVFTTWKPKLRAHNYAPLLLWLTLLNLRTLQPMDIQAPLPAYDFYSRMRDEPYDYVVVEIPTAGGSAIHWIGSAEHQAFQFYGATHGKKMINGHLTRVSTQHWWYLRTDDPLLSWLGQRRNLEPEAVQPELEDMIFNDPVGYLVLHQNAVGREQGANEEILGYFNSLPISLLCPPIVERDAVLYRTGWHPDGCESTRTPVLVDGEYKLDWGASGDEIFLGAGWHYPETIAGVTWRWMGKTDEATLYLTVPPADYQLMFSAQALKPDQTVQVWVNGQNLTPENLLLQAGGLQEISLPLSKTLFTQGEGLVIRFIVISEETDLTAQRRLTLALDWLTLTP